MSDVKKDLITLLKKGYVKFRKDNPNSGKITSKWFRNFLKGTNYSEKDYVEIWGTWKQYNEEIVDEIKRVEIDIHKEANNTNSKRYFVSCIIEGAPVDDDFMESVLAYCKHNHAELVLLVSRGVLLKDYFAETTYKKYNKYFATEYKFNDNLIAKDFMLSPQMIRSLTGLNRFGQKKFSVITAHPKQFLETVSVKKLSLPHIVCSTGTICNPKYRSTRVGVIAEQDNLVGGLVVEVVDSKHFHIRQIQADNNNGFYDLDYYYCKGKKSKGSAEAIICGDIHYGVEDEISIKATKEQVSLLNPKQVLFHDLFDGKSVNPHIEDDMVQRLSRPSHQSILEDELNYLGEKLIEWVSEFPKQNFYVVASNHDDFVDRYLTKRKFADDEKNIYLSCELFRSLVEGKNPVEYFIKKNFTKVEKIKFLKLDESHSICEIETNVHGHLGSNGARGSVQDIERTYGKSVSAHSHSPRIFREVYVTGCNCQLIQDYNKGGSSWLHANVIIYPNGMRQLIVSVNGNWRL